MSRSVIIEKYVESNNNFKNFDDHLDQKKTLMITIGYVQNKVENVFK